MDAVAWLTEHATRRIPHRSFACLSGCGFCCTYPPEVTQGELHAIEAETDLASVGIDPSGTMRLPLQGGCGGCTLLEDRRCTAYEQRPMHCRLFPFHVYFGREVEVYADRVCPGLDPDDTAPDADAPVSAVDDALAAAAADVASDRLEENRREALAVHAEFEALAREHGVWAELDELIPAAVDEAAVTEDAWEAALEPLRSDQDAALPTMVLPEEGFPWRSWRLDDGAVIRLVFDEAGAMEPVGEIELTDDAREPPLETRAVLERLVGYECFAGMVYDRVDAFEYEIDLEQALAEELAEVLAALSLRAHLLEAEEHQLTEALLAGSYEPAFYDRPTIGAWL